MFLKFLSQVAKTGQNLTLTVMQGYKTFVVERSNADEILQSDNSVLKTIKETFIDVVQMLSQEN